MRQGNNHLGIADALNNLCAAKDAGDLNDAAFSPFLDTFRAESLVVFKESHSSVKPFLTPLATVNQTRATLDKYFKRYCETDPVVDHWHMRRDRDHRNLDVFRFSDVGPVRTDTARGFNHFLAKAHVRHMLICALEIDESSGESVIFALHRSPKATDFGEAERQVAKQAAPIMRQVFRGLRYDSIAKTVNGLAERILVDFQHRSALLISRGGRILGETAHATQTGLAERLLANRGYSDKRRALIASRSEATYWLGLEWRPLGPECNCVLALEPSEELNTLADLTPRQSEIAKLVARGCRNWQIAQLLEVSENTVVNHLSNIYNRLGIGSRTELATKWQQRSS